MGIWEAACSTVDTLKRKLPDPAPVKNVVQPAYSSVVDNLSRGAPYVTAPVAGIVRSSYNHGRSALSTVVVQAGRVQQIKESMPDKERLKRIGWNLTDLALDKCSRPYTGGLPVYRTVMEGLLTNKDVKATQNIKEEEMQELRNRMDLLEAAMLSSQQSHPPLRPHRRVAALHQNRPEDVISIFMMKGFSGADFTHDQVVWHHLNWKRDALLCPSLVFY